MLFLYMYKMYEKTLKLNSIFDSHTYNVESLNFAQFKLRIYIIYLFIQTAMSV